MHRKQIAWLVLLFAPAAAFAGSLEKFELTPTFSYNFGGTISGQDSTLSDFDLHANDGESYGLTFDIPLSSFAQIEILASRQETELEYDRGLFGGNVGFSDFQVTYYQVGGLFQWGNGQVHPYIVASLGVANLDPQFAGAQAENKFAGSIGGGVKIFFTDNIGLRLEARGFWTVLDGNSSDYSWDDSCHHNCDYGYSNTFDQGQASAGLIIAW